MVADNIVLGRITVIGSADGTDVDALDGHTDCIVVEGALGKLFNVNGPADGPLGRHTDCIVVEAALDMLVNVIGSADGWNGRPFTRWTHDTDCVVVKATLAGHASQRDRTCGRMDQSSMQSTDTRTASLFSKLVNIIGPADGADVSARFRSKTATMWHAAGTYTLIYANHENVQQKYTFLQRTCDQKQ